MPEALTVAAFHILRPWWLLGIAAALVLYLLHRRGTDPTSRWGGLVAPHLLKHLTVEGGSASRWRTGPITFFALGLGSLAVAGPAWEKEPPPFADDRAALVIVIDASLSMDAVDVQPSRLERARQKVRDLLAVRPGAKTGLVAYAGSAHEVLPLTSDRGIVELYADSLASNVMPMPGKQAAQALALAEAMLARDKLSGSILFLTDGIPDDQRAAFHEHKAAQGARVFVLAIGSEAGAPIRLADGSFATDAAGKRRVARLHVDGLDDVADVTQLTADASDVERIAARVQRSFETVRDDDASLRWRDRGTVFVLPLLLLVALWFRRGWVVRWAAVLLVGFVLFDAETARAEESGVADLFWTADQQGRRHFERGEYKQAAAHFQDPLWKGVAFYAAEDFENAVNQFARVDTAEGWFNLGNAYAHLGRYEDALESYTAVLQRDAEHTDALANHALVEALWKREQAKEDEEPAKGGDLLGADEIKIADPDDKTKRPESEEEVPGGVMDEKMAEVWMRQVQTRPSAFLRHKFKTQLLLGDPAKARKEDDEDDK